jgi:CxxC motif-containing protein
MVKWILICGMECEQDVEQSAWRYQAHICPRGCPYSTYEKEQTNTEVPDDE